MSRAPVWALVVALGWAIGWMITRAAGIDLALQWSVFGSSGALMFQLLTGLTLAWLLQGGRLHQFHRPDWKHNPSGQNDLFCSLLYVSKYVRFQEAQICKPLISALQSKKGL